QTRDSHDSPAFHERTPHVHAAPAEGAAAASARAGVAGARSRRRSAEPDPAPERLPLPSPVPDRPAPDLRRAGSGPDRARGARRSVSLRVDGGSGAARARDRGGGSVIERRMIGYEHELLAGLEHPCFVARGAKDGPRLSLIGGIHGCEYSSVAAVIRFMNELDTAELAGTITAVPVVSLESFRARS